jgi:hypothetical protein
MPVLVRASSICPKLFSNYFRNTVQPKIGSIKKLDQSVLSFVVVITSLQHVIKQCLHRKLSRLITGLVI